MRMFEIFQWHMTVIKVLEWHHDVLEWHKNVLFSDGRAAARHGVRIQVLWKYVSPKNRPLSHTDNTHRKSCRGCYRSLRLAAWSWCRSLLARYYRIRKYWRRLPSQPSDPLCSEFGYVRLYFTTPKVYYVIYTLAYSRASTYHPQRSAPNHPSRRTAPDAGTATARLSRSQRGFEGMWGWRQPTIDCQYVGHDMGVQTAHIR